ncbi:MAG: hypothetical protein JSV04_13110 [Candidatus Heimdallarchaeota archaeon]|nr:MAG: hypothetical protein JSV04_13110 [Candidatus Heimdallarchaeota archaeon]
MMRSIGFTEFFLKYLIQIFLQDAYTIVDMFIIFLGPGTVLFFTFYLMWSGRRKNHKIMKLTREALLEVFSDEFSDLVMDEMSSNGGLLYPKYKKSFDSPFKDFRVVFALEERHLMLSVIISKFSGVNDYIALEANSKKGKIPTKIQIIPKHEEGQIKKHQDLLFTLDEIQLRVQKLDDFFVLKATSQRSGTYFLGDKELLKLIYTLRKVIVRISIDSGEDPAIRIYARINEDLNLEKLHELFLVLCKRVDEVSEKVVMKKRRG